MKTFLKIEWFIPTHFYEGGDQCMCIIANIGIMSGDILGPLNSLSILFENCELDRTNPCTLLQPLDTMVQKISSTGNRFNRLSCLHSCTLYIDIGVYQFITSILLIP